MPGSAPWRLQVATEFLKEGLHAVEEWWLENRGAARGACRCGDAHRLDRICRLDRKRRLNVSAGGTALATVARSDRTARSDIRPALHAARDRDHPRQEDPENRQDHAQSDLIRLQSLHLPFQEDSKGQPPNSGDLGIELATQVGDHAVVAV